MTVAIFWFELFFEYLIWIIIINNFQRLLAHAKQNGDVVELPDTFYELLVIMKALNIKVGFCLLSYTVE